MRKRITITAMALLVMCWAGVAWGTDYYVAQTEQGTGGGLTEANADSVTTFNTGAAPYDALDDDTVYLIDTITTQIELPDSGTSGHVVTIEGLPGTRPVVWSIFGNGQDYVTIRNIEILGNILADGTNWTIDRVLDSYENGTSIALNGVNNSAAGLDPTITVTGSPNILWVWGDGTTSTSANPGTKDYGSAEPRRFVVIVSDVTAITSFSCINDDVTGNSPDISKLVNLTEVDFSDNSYKGSLPDISRLVNLSSWKSNGNSFIGSLPDISGLTSLTSWISAFNQNSGDLPDISGCINLVTWRTHSNKHTGVAFTSLPSSIQTFRIDSNLLTQAAVDEILCSLDDAGASGAYTCNVGGTGNAAPSAAGTACAGSLTGKGWTVTVN